LSAKEQVIIKEKKMKRSQKYRVGSTPEGPKSVLRGMMQCASLIALACTLVIGATGSAEAQQIVSGTTQAAPPIAGIIGKVQSFTSSTLDVLTASGVVYIEVKQPLTTYKQTPSDLSHVTSASYVGVASTEQADGKEVAKQIIIFPAELSGAAEGSVLTDPPGATTHSRMTNGSVSRPPVSHSRMTNGTVQRRSGTSLVVQYQDGSKSISVPENVAVVEVVAEKVTLAAGDTVYLTTNKLPNGSLTTNKILLIAPAVSPDSRQ
jgi:RNase P/RNase MRP subunit p29